MLFKSNKVEINIFYVMTLSFEIISKFFIKKFNAVNLIFNFMFFFFYVGL